MKKLLMMLSGALVASSAYASPVLNPADPVINTEGVFYCCPEDWWALRVGFRGDYVFDRKLQDASHSYDRYSFYSNEGVLTVNFWKRLDLYGFVGATSQDYASKFFMVGGIAELVGNFETETIWGVGLKALLYHWNWGCDCGTSFITADVNYETVSEAALTTLNYNGTPTDFVGGGVGSNRYRETQVSLAWGHRIKKLIPYIAAKWSNAHISRPQDPEPFSGLENQQHWGWALGVSLVDVCRMTVTAEARFVDETAMTVTGSFRF